MESISDLVGGSSEDGGKRLPIKKIAELIGKKCILNDVKVLRDLQTKFGVMDRTVLVFSDKLGGDEYECWTSSKVITERAVKVKEMGKLPITATIVKKDTVKGYYYSIE